MLRHFQLLPLLAVGLAATACTGPDEFGTNRDDTTTWAPGGSTTTNESGAGTPPAQVGGLGDRTIVQLDADGASQSDRLGVAFLHQAKDTKDGLAVAFVVTDRHGTPRSAPIELGVGASSAAGIGIGFDPASHTFFVAWADGASPARLHVHSIADGGAATALPPLAFAKAEELQGLDVFSSSGRVLVSGFAGKGDVFLASIDSKSGAQIDFHSEPLRGAFAPRTSIHGSRGDCHAGNGCMVTVRGAQGAQAAVGKPIVITTTLQSTGDHDNVGRDQYSLGATYEATDVGSFPRVSSDGDRLVSFGMDASGKARLQVKEAPTDKVWRHDFDQERQLGASRAADPVAVAVDADRVAVGVSTGVAGDTLSFATSAAPWTAAGTIQPSAPAVHTLGANLAADPVLVRTRDGWTGVWIEGTRLFVRGF